MQAFSIASVSFFLLLDKRVKWEARNDALQVPTALVSLLRERGRRWVNVGKRESKSFCRKKRGVGSEIGYKNSKLMTGSIDIESDVNGEKSQQYILLWGTSQQKPAHGTHLTSNSLRKVTIKSEGHVWQH